MQEIMFPKLPLGIPLSVKRVIKRIKQQQRDMGYGALVESDSHFRWNYIRDISLSLMKEVGEFLDEIPWKPWLAIADQDCNTEKAAMEIIDILVFTLVLWITLNPSIDIEEAIEKTMTKIEDRIKHGYGQQTEEN
jgi:NTP pyrophosphatase (non-canonical NTP hydrolase)